MKDARPGASGKRPVLNNMADSTMGEPPEFAHQQGVYAERRKLYSRGALTTSAWGKQGTAWEEIQTPSPATTEADSPKGGRKK